ncbi:hypothetical protein [Streptococcus phage vB_SbRt-pBovineS21]|nr:hypothetical protein [Streptococcus phage vB_SbRt-pBovineS21]
MLTLIFLFIAITLGLQIVIIIAINFVNDTVLKVYELVCSEADKIREELHK